MTQDTTTHKKKHTALQTPEDRRSARRLLLLGPTLVGVCVLLAVLLAVYAN